MAIVLLQNLPTRSSFNKITYIAVLGALLTLCYPIGSLSYSSYNLSSCKFRLYLHPS
nr:MAG TPA: hypothetical protein [Caudoviricetes sp.]